MMNDTDDHDHEYDDTDDHDHDYDAYTDHDHDYDYGDHVVCHCLSCF